MMAKERRWCRLCGGVGIVDDSQIEILGGRTEFCPRCDGTGDEPDSRMGCVVLLLYALVVAVTFGLWARFGG